MISSKVRARYAEMTKRYADAMAGDDALAQQAVQGHLLLEEAMAGIVETYAFSPKYVAEAQLSFAQLIMVTRAWSPKNERSNAMWALISSFNSLRNGLAHRSKAEQRQARLEKVLAQFKQTVPEADMRKLPNDRKLGMVVAALLGFLSSHQELADQFRELVEEAFDARYQADDKKP